MAKTVIIPGRLHNPEQGNVVTGANEILDDTKGKKQNVINSEVDAELVRLDNSKQDNLTFDSTPTENSTNPVTSGGVYAAELTLSQAIEAILLLIPSAASALNKLVDTETMNSSIATATASFKGTYNLVTDLSLGVDATHEQIAAKLLEVITTADNNDYAFVQVPTNAGTPTEIRVTERYKFNGTSWAYEYDLNNSGFTAAQWAAINSGITALLVSKLSELPTATELATALAGKQAVLTFDNAPTQNSDNPVKSGGIYTAIKNETDARELSEQGLQQGISTNAGDISDIKDVLPSGATAVNKLVDNDSMVSYITTLISGISATFNVTSADGHITLHITQVDGEITSVTITTSDIASAAALNLKASQADLEALVSFVNTKASQSDLTTLAGRVSVNETDISNLQAAYAGLTQSDIIIGALPASGVADTIYRVPGTSSYSDYMWNGSAFVIMATYNNGVDDVPTYNSNNFVKSGGVKYDLLLQEAELFGVDVNADFSTYLPYFIQNKKIFKRCLVSSNDDLTGYRFGLSYLSWNSYAAGYLYFQIIAGNGTERVPLVISIAKSTWNDGEWIELCKQITLGGTSKTLFISILPAKTLTPSDSIPAGSTPISNWSNILVKNFKDTYCQNNIPTNMNVINMLTTHIDVEDEGMLSKFNENRGSYIEEFKVWSNYVGRIQMVGVWPNNGNIYIGIADSTGTDQGVLYQEAIPYVQGDLVGIKSYDLIGNRNDYSLNFYVHVTVNWDKYDASKVLWGNNLGIYLNNNPIGKKGWGAYFKMEAVCHSGDNILAVIANNQGKTIYIESGTYDIIAAYKQIFGNSYFDNYQGYTSGGFPYGAGIPLFDGTKLVCSPNAKITCKYDGDNQNVMSTFSAFACGNGYEIDGMNLETENIHYAIHDDFNTINTQYNVVVKNCHLVHNGQVIGGGLGICGNYLIENNWIERIGEGVGIYDMRYHNNSGVSKNRLTFVGNYFAHTLRICNYGASDEHTTECLVSGNTMSSAIIHNNETTDPTEENIKVVEWNNYIRQ